MKKLLGTFANDKRARAGAETSLGASAGILGASQMPSAVDSAAFSTMIRNASIKMDMYIADLEADDVTPDVVTASHWVRKVKMYANSSLPRGLCRLSLTKSEWAVVYACVLLSKYIYTSGTGSPPLRSLHDIKEVQAMGFDVTNPFGVARSIDASVLDGRVKTTTIHHFVIGGQRRVVVAVKGSASIRKDWTLNFNERGEGQDGIGFLDVGETKYIAHGGFLAAAKQMIPSIARAISEILTVPVPTTGTANDTLSTQVPRAELIFTGHSAGGAIAGLLWGHMHSRNRSELTALQSKFSAIRLITFGAPPITHPAFPISSQLDLAFANDGDPVVRIDEEYINSLLRCLVTPSPPTTVPWELPTMTLLNAGKVVVLDDSDRGGGEDTVEALVMERLEDCLWGNVWAHGVDVYVGRIKEMVCADI